MNEKKTALITGITGQDGSYLAELLLEKGYEVHGTIRRSSVFTTERIEHIFDHKNLFTHHSDVTDSSNINRFVFVLFLSLAISRHVNNIAKSILNFSPSLKE